jgi:hypothetical protein
VQFSPAFQIHFLTVCRDEFFSFALAEHCLNLETPSSSWADRSSLFRHGKLDSEDGCIFALEVCGQHGQSRQNAVDFFGVLLA